MNDELNLLQKKLSNISMTSNYSDRKCCTKCLQATNKHSLSFRL